MLCFGCGWREKGGEEEEEGEGEEEGGTVVQSQNTTDSKVAGRGRGGRQRGKHGFVI